MWRLTVREWVDLRFAHPSVDPQDPTDEFAVALLTAVGADPDVWETGSESEALDTYRDALGFAVPSTDWARRTIVEDPVLGLVVSVCAEYQISIDTFSAWSQPAQELALAWAEIQRDRCPAGHSPDLRADADNGKIERSYCDTCAHVVELERTLRERHPAEMLEGFYTVVSNVRD